MSNKIATALTTLILGFSVYNSVYNEPQDLFKQWQLMYAKTYNAEEYAYRYNIFKRAAERVSEHNERARRGEESY